MGVLLKILLGGLAVGALAVLVVLVPPQLQVRRVEPALPDVTALEGLLAQPDGPVRVRYVETASQETPNRTLGHVSFLVEWSDGRAFVIDAGMDREEAAEFAELMESLMGGGEAVFHGDVGALLGDDVARVAGMGFTHLHIDHAQGVGAFCRSRGAGARLIQTRDQAELHNLHTREGAEMVAGSCLDPLPLTGAELLSADGFPGLGIVALGGHTPGSTLFAVPVERHLWLLSGDITNRKADILENRGKGFAYSYLMVPENTARTEKLRLWLAALDARDDTTVVVSHDLPAIQASGMAPYSR